ncbi:hypothetical protein F5X96DRAFT_662398 [Biscogniauxia mediterranea]|nr:hypothetical protein F5X96DRAFT_662398 [Biscogniauxia mediterranea]
MPSSQGETTAAQPEQPTQSASTAVSSAESPSTIPTPPSPASPAPAAQVRQSEQSEQSEQPEQQSNEALRQAQNAHQTEGAPESQNSQPSQPSRESSQAVDQGQDLPTAAIPPPTAAQPPQELQQLETPPVQQSQTQDAPQSTRPTNPQASIIKFKLLPAAPPPTHQNSQQPQQAQQVQQGHQAPSPQTAPRPPPPPPPNPHAYPSFAQQQEARRQHLYAVLGDLDPHRSTPKEFIHLLVEAGMRDGEIAESIYRMHEYRLRNPHCWTPVSARFAPPPQQQQQHSPSQVPPYQHPYPPPYPHQHLQPVPPPVPPGHQGFPHPAPPGPYMPPGVHHPPPNTPSHTHAIPNAPPNTPNPATPQLPHGPNPPSQAPPGQIEPSRGPLAPGQHPGPGMNSAAVVPAPDNRNDDATETYDGPPEPQEPPCNFTWVVDRAEVQLGWTGNWDKMSEIRQTSIGYTVAFKLQKLEKKMNAMMDKFVTFPNRVHILTVMREIMAATLETDSRVGEECRECAREYDDNFVEAVRKLTLEQRRRLRTLEGGKWMQELRELIDEAKRQSLFRRLEQAFTCINSDT